MRPSPRVRHPAGHPPGPAPAARPDPASRPGPVARRRSERFVYDRLDVDETTGTVYCRYRLDGQRFTETVEVGPGRRWTDAAHQAARLVHLLAGVSYYKVGAPPVIDLGDLAVRAGEREFLRDFYLSGLGEFAFRNGLDLTAIDVVGGRDATGPLPAAAVDRSRPLVPFGGGIDSLVTVDLVRGVHPDAALFVVDRRGNRFAAIEKAAAATGLPTVHVERAIDSALLRPATPAAAFNGHVPVTGILSAIAVLTAVLEGRGQVVMSNEWSASQGNLVAGGLAVNHQWSKSDVFENGFRALVAGALARPPDYFSLLRSRSELWVARHFARLDQFHPVVHSCNRAFHLDPAKRADQWCGVCDKCCFIDLILAPFLSRAALEQIFAGREPLANPDLLPQFRDLLAIGAGPKPFECVGDTDECRSATVLAAARPDRDGGPGGAVLAALVVELGGPAAAEARSGAHRLLQPLSDDHVPDALAAAAALV